MTPGNRGDPERLATGDAQAHERIRTDGNDDATEDDDVEVVDLTLLSGGRAARTAHTCLLGELIEELRAQPGRSRSSPRSTLSARSANEIVQAVRVTLTTSTPPRSRI